MPGRRRATDLAATALLALTAAWYVHAAFWLRANGHKPGFNLDYYGYFYPNWLYARQALARGWGLLWNPFLNCGQPFLAIPTTGLFYPPHAVFLLFGLDVGQYVEIALHLTIGGLGLYWLARELDIGAAGALAGAMAFLLGAPTIQLAAWLPTVIAPYAWLPAALAGAERVLRAPRLANALLLAVVLAVQILGGYPQITFFTYLAIGVRAAVVLAVPPAGVRRPALLGALALGLALPLGLAAVQFVPALEFARQSLRAGRLTRAEIFPTAQVVSWPAFLTGVGRRAGMGATVMLVSASLAGAALLGSRRHALVWSYGALLALSLALAFDTPVFEAFYRLPIGGSFRLPQRFLWLAACLMAVLTALGVDAAARGARRPLLLLGTALGAAAFTALSPVRLYLSELPLLIALAGCLALAVFAPRIGRRALLVVPVLVAVNCLLSPRPASGPVRNGDILLGRRAAFEWLRERATPQTRMYPLAPPLDFSLVFKTPSLFGVRSITDYETQASRRLAEIYVRTFTGRPMQSINDYYIKLVRAPRNRPLFDLLGARYILTDVRTELDVPGEPPLVEIAKIEDSVVYENPAALPRAFYAPRADVVPDPAKALQRLATAGHDPRQLVLLERPPADGFLGAAGAPAGGAVAITADRGETLELTVDAPAEGFLVLTDQDYPGWEAAVNGVPAPVQRANVAFRALHVPAGRSQVTFRYRPFSLTLGIALSAASWAFVLGYASLRAARAARRPRGSLPPHGF
jgi:hypothetical protein